MVGTVAAQFNDGGANELFHRLMQKIAEKTGKDFSLPATEVSVALQPKGAGTHIIPPKRVRYLSEIAETIQEYDKWVEEQSAIATRLYQLDGVMKMDLEKKS